MEHWCEAGNHSWSCDTFCYGAYKMNCIEHMPKEQLPKFVPREIRRKAGRDLDRLRAEGA